MATAHEVELILAQAQAPQHLERTKAFEKIKTLLDDGISEDQTELLCRGLISLLRDERVEAKLGAFSASVLMIPTASQHLDFLKVVTEACKENLEHRESRVRVIVGECIHAIASIHSMESYHTFEAIIVSSILRNFERDEDSNQERGEGKDDLMESLLKSSYKVVTPGTGDMRHGTEGWKSLETSFRAYLKLIEGAGSVIFPLVSEDLWQLIFRGFEHSNRFVREIAFSALGALVNISSLDQPISDQLLLDVSQKLAKGLADDWSQVRYSASIATRTFMLKEDRSHLFLYILPQMCLNRYYIAEGVRLYSQETWKFVVGEKGREFVAHYAPQFVDYYIRQCGANNHAVREAACGCIAELMTKIEKTSIETHVPRLITALVNCFKDASWPVRDAACLACGQCVIAFPEQARSTLDELYSLWIAHLADNISSVREDSAIALGNAIKAYREEALDIILPQLKELIFEAKNQKSDSKSFSGLKNTTKFGVADPQSIATDEDLAHTDQTMFSCGSLAPKLARGGGCMDHGFKRPKEPWEVSDGAVYLMREISNIYPDKVLEFIPAMTELAYLSEFLHACNLHETIWKAMPVIGKNIGKRNFKMYLSEMLDALFRSVRSDHQLEAAAATGFISFCSDFLGRGIFRGRLNPDQATVFDSLVPPY